MITFENKEDIRESNLPRKNRIVADDINQLKAYANRVQVFDAVVSYSGIIAVGVNDIGSVGLSTSGDVIILSFPSAFTSRIVTVNYSNGDNGNIEKAYYLNDGESIEIYQTAGVNITNASITIKSYPND